MPLCGPVSMITDNVLCLSFSIELLWRACRDCVQDMFFTNGCSYHSLSFSCSRNTHTHIHAPISLSLSLSLSLCLSLSLSLSFSLSFTLSLCLSLSLSPVVIIMIAAVVHYASKHCGSYTVNPDPEKSNGAPSWISVSVGQSSNSAVPPAINHYATTNGHSNGNSYQTKSFRGTSPTCSTHSFT